MKNQQRPLQIQDNITLEEHGEATVEDPWLEEDPGEAQEVWEEVDIAEGATA